MATEPFYPPRQYLEMERKAEYKSEYWRGRIYAMAGASREHNLITMSIASQLSSQLRERPCEVYASEMRVKVSETGLYTYPDVTVVCGEAQFEDAEVDTLLNPSLIIEVLSESTAAYDRGVKFEHYRKVESIADYVLVAQDAPRVEHLARQPDGRWLLTVIDDPAGELALPSIDCHVPMAEIYRKVVFA